MDSQPGEMKELQGLRGQGLKGFKLFNPETLQPFDSVELTIRRLWSKKRISYLQGFFLHERRPQHGFRDIDRYR